MDKDMVNKCLIMVLILLQHYPESKKPRKICSIPLFANFHN